MAARDECPVERLLLAASDLFEEAMERGDDAATAFWSEVGGEVLMHHRNLASYYHTSECTEQYRAEAYALVPMPQEVALELTRRESVLRDRPQGLTG